MEYVYFKFREWYASSQIRELWKKSKLRKRMPFLFIGQTTLTKENATPEQLELMRRTEAEWNKFKYNKFD